MAVFSFNGSPATVLGSTFSQTQNILEALASFAHSRRPQNLGKYTSELDMEDLAHIVDLNTETGAKDFWLSVVANLIAAKHDDEAFSAGFAPFTVIIEKDNAEVGLPRLRDLLWTTAGRPRRNKVNLSGTITLPSFFEHDIGTTSGRRRSTAAAEQNDEDDEAASDDGSVASRDGEDSEDEDEDDGEDMDEGEEVGEEQGSVGRETSSAEAFPQSGTKSTSLLSRLAPPQSHLIKDRHSSMAPPPSSSAKRAASPTPLAEHRRPSPPKPKATFPSLSRHSRSQGEDGVLTLDSDSDDEPQPRRSTFVDNPVFAEADSAVDAIFARQTVEAFDNVPPEARATAIAAAAFARRKSEKGGDKEVKLFLNSFTELRLPYEVKLAIYNNKFWQLDKVNAFSYNSPSSVAVPSGIEGLFVAAPSDSSPIRTPLEWDDAFIEISKLVVYLYPNRKDELDRYRRHFLAFVRQDQSSFQVYYLIDQDFRKHLGQPGQGHTLDDAPTRYSFLLSNHTLQALRRAPSSPSKPSNSPKKSKPSSPRKAEGPCSCWNDETDPEILEAAIPPCRDPSKLLPGRRICTRKHVCSTCGGKHRAMACSEGGGGRGGRGDKKGAGDEVGGERGRTDGAPPFSLRQ